MIRPATVDDVPVLVDLIVELATYEREPEQAQATAEQLRDALFAPEPAVYCLLAEDDSSGEIAGFALWFRTFSTWLGRHGVRPDTIDQLLNHATGKISRTYNRAGYDAEKRQAVILLGELVEGALAGEERSNVLRIA